MNIIFSEPDNIEQIKLIVYLNNIQHLMYRYAATAVTFMITARTTRSLFSEDTVKVADSKLQVSTVHLSYNWFSTMPNDDEMQSK